jgi:site-specific recombinase XerD
MHRFTRLVLFTSNHSKMRSSNTFGVHFVLRPSSKAHSIFARIVVNKSRCELALKQTIDKQDWNIAKGAARPRTPALKQLNSYLEEVRAKLVSSYQQLNLAGEYFTAEMLKNAHLGKTTEGEEKMTLNRLVALHNEMLAKTLEPGTMKNYKSTAIYLKNFMMEKYHAGDISLKDLTYQFITGFEWYVRNNPIKAGDPCTNNGTMKHLERLKKMVTWACTNEWIEKDPFAAYKLRFKRCEMDFLDKDELARIERRNLENPMLRRVRDLFIFSCYTGLAYIDLVMLKPANIMAGSEGMQWIRTSRKKTEIPLNVPLLRPAIAILEKFRADENAQKGETLFPLVSNQEMNRSLKLIGEICEIKKRLTFHLARHTFATTVTLLNGVPIETISKLLGHTKLATTMIYAHVMQSKIGMDMRLLQTKLDLGDRA